MLKEEREAAERARKQEEAAKYRATLLAVRKLGSVLEIDYEFTKGFEDGGSTAPFGVVIKQAGSKSVFDGIATDFQKKGTLRLSKLAGGNYEGRVEVSMVLLGRVRQPEFTISNTVVAE